MTWPIHARLDGPLVMIGFGSIGKGTLPLLMRHITFDHERMVIIDPDDRARAIADQHGIRFVQTRLTGDNYREVLGRYLTPGGFLLNLSVEVASCALIELAEELGCAYLDTCIEPWPGGYTDPSLSASQRSNYAMRERALTLRRSGAIRQTAVIAHGANPGLVSHFTKQALLNLAADSGIGLAANNGNGDKRPRSREEWANLAQRLGVQGIHIAERDTQRANRPKVPGEFVNTWSIEGFLSEGLQPAEVGWGTHEKVLPPEGRRHDFGSDAAIYLLRPGAGTRVRSWTPNEGPYQGFLITHNESISIADYLTVRNGDGVVYRPTCHYAYHPCDDAVLSLHELQGKYYRQQEQIRLMDEEITTGMDELGVLLYGHARNAYWYGSQLTIEETRQLIPYQNATGLQVTIAVLAGMVWALEHPMQGIVEADDIDHEKIMAIATPYLGRMHGEYTAWTPLVDRERLFPEDIDRESPWQFKNVMVR